MSEGEDVRYMFCATMQLRTPLRYLRMHGTIRKHAPTTTGQEHGIWLPLLPGQTKFFGTMASEIGYVPADGGEFLQFLLAAKTAASGRDPVKVRRARLQRVLEDPRSHEFANRFGWAAIEALCERP